MEQSNKLYRSRTDRIIAGVCGGLAEYFRIDPVIVRLVFILLAFLNGIGIVLYILLLIAVPSERGEADAPDRDEKIREFVQDVGERAQTIAQEIRQESGRHYREEAGPADEEARNRKDPASGEDWWQGRRNIIGLLIAMLGLVLLFNQFFPMHWLNWKVAVSLALVVFGFYIILKDRKQ